MGLNWCGNRHPRRRAYRSREVSPLPAGCVQEFTHSGVVHPQTAGRVGGLGRIAVNRPDAVHRGSRNPPGSPLTPGRRCACSGRLSGDAGGDQRLSTRPGPIGGSGGTGVDLAGLSVSRSAAGRGTGGVPPGVGGAAGGFGRSSGWITDVPRTGWRLPPGPGQLVDSGTPLGGWPRDIRGKPAAACLHWGAMGPAQRADYVDPAGLLASNRSARRLRMTPNSGNAGLRPPAVARG